MDFGDSTSDREMTGNDLHVRKNLCGQVQDCDFSHDYDYWRIHVRYLSVETTLDGRCMPFAWAVALCEGYDRSTNLICGALSYEQLIIAG